MLAKFMTAGLVGSAFLATVAFAQTPAATDSAKPATAAAASDTSFQGTWRGSKLVGLNVYNDSNESLGSINDLLMDKSGNIKGVVIGVGGFLGMGEHDIAVTMDKLKFMETPVQTSSTAPAGTTRATTTSTAPAGTATTTGAANSTTTTTTTARTADANDWVPDHAVMNGTKDQLKAMPQFKYSDYN